MIGILNNRADRGRRAELFASMVPRDLSDYLDHVVTFGAYEETVTSTMVAGGYPADRVHRLGATRAPASARSSTRSRASWTASRECWSGR